uniref:FYVE-type domain-containing protein n=1 Tax=Hyaloperonospora arabidopsidis (strain Emoy2) TaxID=559515 RepID=M4B1M9_HYAAE
MVEKSYRVNITDTIERNLRFLGQSRIDALTFPFAMKLLKDKSGLKLYELCEKEFYTMKAVTTVHAPIQEVMHMLRMDSTSRLRDSMGNIFGPLFLDGVVLYTQPESTTRPNESMSVSWTALQASKPNLQHRDYVFLRYNDMFEKDLEHGGVYQSNGSGLHIGASIWESIELDGCEPLPPSQNVVRLRLRRSGIVVEETGRDGALNVSLFLSEGHPGRDMVSSLTRSWMTKVVSCVSQIPNALLTRALSSHSLLTKRDFRTNGPNCYLCRKAFTVFRRKHHCRVCGDIVCRACSEMTTLCRSSRNKEVRLCSRCHTTSTAPNLASNRSSNPVLFARVEGSARSLPSFSSSLESCNLDASNASVSGSTTNVTESISETVRPKTHPLKRNGSFRRQRPRVLDPVNKVNQSGSSHPVEDESNMTSEFSESSEFHWMDGLTRLSVHELALLEKKLTVRANTPFNYALNYSDSQEWPEAPVPTNEAGRLKKVRELHLADPSKQFQEMCEYAAAELGCQIATISFIGDKSGFLMAKIGLKKREMARNILLDAHTIMSAEPTVILDATEDLRFTNNPLVTDGRVRFFAGFPMITTDGHVVGSFSVADPFARALLPGDKYLFLRNLADVAVRGVEQNTLMSLAVQRDGGNVHMLKPTIQAPLPPETGAVGAEELTMQELLRSAYTTKCQVRMHVNPLPE